MPEPQPHAVDGTKFSFRLPDPISPARMLAWSETVMESSPAPNPHIALWLPNGMHAAIGISQTPAEELAVEAIIRDRISVIRRQSGGGAVLLYPGVLCWEAWASLDTIARIHPEGSGIRHTYAALSRPVRDGLRRLGLAVFRAGISDISIISPKDGLPRKLAGTAQLRRREMALVHGSLLVNPDLSALSRYLLFPSRQPDYRMTRPHEDFCITVADAMEQAGHAPADLMPKVADSVLAAARAMDWRITSPPADLSPDAEWLIRNKYLYEGWNWKKLRQPRENPSAT